MLASDSAEVGPLSFKASLMIKKDLQKADVVDLFLNGFFPHDSQSV